MKRLKETVCTACLVGGLAAGGAHAALITSAVPLGPTTVIDFQQFASVNFANAVPLQVGTPVGLDVELYGIGTFDTYVGPVSHSLGSNGQWNSTTDVNFRSARLPVSSSLAMDFVFNTAAVSGVGGFMNYAPGYGPVTIEAFDAGGVLLESYVIDTVAPINTAPGSLNEGEFRGIQRGTADIARFRLSGGFAVIDDLTFTGVPEPASLVLMAASGLALITRNFRGERNAS